MQRIDQVKIASMWKGSSENICLICPPESSSTLAGSKQDVQENDTEGVCSTDK